MNFYDVLAAEKWDGGIPTTNFFDLLFAQYMGGGEQWQTYEGTLPATINANGDNMKQYQVWGATGGVGDRTENLCEIDGFDSGTTEQKLLQTVVLNAGTYTYSCVQKDALTSNTRNCLMIRIGQAAYTYESTQQNYHLSAGKHTMTFTVSTDNVSVELQYWVNEFSNICAFDDFMLTSGTTPPASFVPFGYEVSLSVSDGTNTTTTPIYIGSNPLNKDEYIDYQVGKIYRMINGVLTPTDPPVPLPVLPTCEGETVVDYAGESVAPEKVYFEYKGGKQP